MGLFSFTKEIAIDLGTANTIIIHNDKIVIDEPSIVAIDVRTGKMVAVGNEAQLMLGKETREIRVVRPLRQGVIADFNAAEMMIRGLIAKASQKNRWFNPSMRMVVGIPSGSTEVEVRAVRDSSEHAGGRDVYMLHEPMAAALGIGIDVVAPEGNMIVDIGGGTTEVAVVTGGGVAVSKSLKIAGDTCDKAIAEYIRKKFNVLIGESTAEEIKLEIGSAHESTDVGMLEVRGRNLATGLPSVFNIYTKEIHEAISEPISAIVDVIKAALEETPPELCADLYDNGITLSGGGALLPGLGTLIHEKTKLPIYIANHPLDCVAEGICKVMKSRGYNNLLEEVKKV